MAEDDKLAKIVEARMRLRARFDAKIASTPAQADGSPLGSGPVNRHGMPQLPVGQTLAKGWPVLDLGRKPVIAKEKWSLVVEGACEHPVTLDWAAFMALPQVRDTSDFHCVTTWSKMDMPFVGVRFADIAALVMPTEKATHVLCHAYDGYTTNVPLEEALKPDVLLAHTYENAPLPIEHGGPVRMITPQLYAWKGAKWINKITLLERDQPGFWETRGYSNTAHPWRNDRYG
jgi:DMSO/TMAO reductase YedYZ molybdopterin-dependent catalytic subunit